MNGWKELFKSHILDRGWDYYQSERVRDVKPTMRGYTAVVDGTDAYAVDIIIQDGHVIDMICDCPYADDGNYCKHMAAVLYKITEEDFEKYKQLYEEKQKKEKQELTEIISKIPEKELREFVLQLALDNGNIRSNVLLKYAGTISEQRMAELKEKIYHFADGYADRYGYINGENAYDYICGLESYIFDTVQKLLENQHCMEAFELVNEAFSSAANQDMDDSDDGLAQLAGTCYDLWEQILEKCDEKQQMKLFEAMKSSVKSSKTNELVGDYMQEFLMYEFHDESTLKENLDMLDREIEEALLHRKDEWNSRYVIENHLIQRMQIMKEMEFSPKEIVEYRNKYREFPAMRIMEIDEYMEDGNIVAAIEVLKESRDLDKELPGMAEQYSKKLIALYHRSDRNKEYKQELISYIFSYRQSNLEYIYKLKEVIPANEWHLYCDKILSERTCEQIRYDFLEKEAMYEKLLTEVLKEPYIGYLDHYEKVLQERFPQQVRDRYIKYVKQAADRATQRNAYKNLMTYLNKIKKYPDGAQITKEIVSEWRVEYRRRRAMMDELKKAGF